jgi:hypothetical protein
MILYFNDLSADGKFKTNEDTIESLLRLYQIVQKLTLHLVITKNLLLRPAVGSTKIHEIILKGGKSQRTLLLGWLAKSGPFIEDDRLEIDDDLWWHEAAEVTDQGLGEAARRQLISHPVASFSSSEGCDNKFNCSPLKVFQGFPDEPISVLSITNIWSITDLGAIVEHVRGEPRDWSEFITQCTRRYDFVSIDTENFYRGLNKHPFNGNVVRRGFALLEVLNNVASGLEADGSLSPSAMRLVTEHFQGGKAWFSSEEPTDKNLFYFEDHSVSDKRIYCSWHGKIKTPQFRLHFEWPVPVGQKKIKVLYLGEKLSKW